MGVGEGLTGGYFGGGLVGTYAAWVWKEIYIHGKSWLRAEQFFGFLRFKYKSDQLGARLPFAIPNLFWGNTST